MLKHTYIEVEYSSSIWAVVLCYVALYQFNTKNLDSFFIPQAPTTLAAPDAARIKRKAVSSTYGM